MDMTPTHTHSLETDTRTPSPTQHTSLTNGFLKRHRHRHPTAPSPPSAVVFYKECLKNHAASLGGHALDGCGEFMPSSSCSTEPRSLTCAACGCHRNFHRRDTQEFSNPHFISFYHSPPPSHRGPSLSTSPSRSPSPSLSPSPPPLSQHFPPSYHRHSSAPHVLIALGNPDEGHVNRTEENLSGRKRHRTKFSQEQKEKMLEFCEKLGWRMPKGGDEGMVDEFCNSIGVSREVFKVWMHNNKNAFKKRSSEMGNDAPSPDEKINNSDGNGNCGDGRDGIHSDINNPHDTNGSDNGIHRN